MTEITKEAIEAAEREFTEYFVRNYPDPVCDDPEAHAAKLFRAAKLSLLATNVQPSPPGKDGGQEVEKLRDAYKKGFEASAEGFNAEYHPAFETDNEWLADCELAVQAIHASPAYSIYSPFPPSTVDVEAVIGRLTKALEPFAAEAAELAEGVTDDCVYALPRFPDLGLSGFDVGDLREAHSVLANLKDKSPSSDRAASEGWQPIETAPKDGTRFLGFYRGKFVIYRWSQRQFDKHGNGWYFTDNGLHSPTHWRSLPTAPDFAEAKGSGQ